MSGIIDISGIKEEKWVEWKISGFFKNPQNITNYESKIYLFRKNWLFTVYPHGIDGKTPEYVILGVVLINPISDFSVDIELDVEGLRLQCQTQYMNNFKMWFWRCKSADLQALLFGDILKGKVIISCNKEQSNLPSTADVSSQTISNTIHFFRDFQDLLQSGRKSDVSIEVQGRMFKVHKLILESCSPVLSAMFDNEKNKGIVKIDDCDSDTFQTFLNCIYSGKLENISPKSLRDLYKISDKYGVLDLKKKCLEFMVRNVSENNILEVLTLTEASKDAHLIASAEEFFIQNIKIILPTKAWKIFQSEKPSIAAETLRKVFEHYNS